jgi:membrane-associated protease RseP (regulator of RpoE activity)
MRTLLSGLAMTLLSVSTLQAQQTGALGVTLRDNPGSGVSIENVIANSPAAQIGLRSGDRILSINNQPIANSGDVVRIIGGMQPNALVELMMVRGAWRGNLTAALGSTVNVFSPNQQFVPVAPPIAQTSRPAMISAPPDVEEWQIPRNLHNDGRRGASASRGMLGY